MKKTKKRGKSPLVALRNECKNWFLNGTRVPQGENNEIRNNE